MAFDEGLAERLREQFGGRHDVAEKRMFGGLAFMVRGHMCVGILGDTLMARVGPAEYEVALREPQARPMDFTGRPMKGYVYVAPAGFEEDAALAGWVACCLSFNGTLPPK
jgi:TfoX/Sxy family transcriptional regulator of competence genes